MPSETCLVFMPHCPGSIAEQIALLPLFHFLAEKHEKQNVIGVAPDHSSFLIKALGAAGALETSPGGVTALAGVVRRLRARHPAVAYQLRRRSLRSLLLARISGTRRVHGYAGGPASWIPRTWIPYDEHEYFGENHARMAGGSLETFGKAFPREDDGYVLFIPGGHDPKAQYPLDCYVQVADGLGRRRPVKFLFGPETKADEILIRHAGHETVIAPELPEMMNLVRRATLVVANDCGPAHAAHIHDVPRISLFGLPQDIPHRFHAGRNGRVMEPPPGKGIGEIEPREVIAAGEALLASTG